MKNEQHKPCPICHQNNSRIASLWAAIGCSDDRTQPLIADRLRQAQKRQAKHWGKVHGARQ